MAEQDEDPALVEVRSIMAAGVAHPVGGVVKRLETQVEQVQERAMRRTLTAEVVLDLD